jgi:hypothetical protein
MLPPVFKLQSGDLLKLLGVGGDRNLVLVQGGDGDYQFIRAQSVYLAVLSWCGFPPAAGYWAGYISL